MTTPLAEVEAQTFEEDDSAELPPSDIVAYNELRSCADLFRMFTQKSLIIQPEFQREIVWKGPAQTRFIDSLIKQLPIPSMCFSLDYKTQKWQVIDGLQRIWSIIRFLSGESWTLSRLDDIDARISGQPVTAFVDENSPLNELFRRVENLTLPITVLRCDYTKKSNTNYLFTIFHRLNTGAMKLNNQEIRNCIFSGTLNDLLKELNATTEWQKINKMKKETGYRFTKQEIILRFFALHDSSSSYKGQLAKFLNEYMEDHRNPPQAFLDTKRTLHQRTVGLIYRKVFKGKVPAKLGVTLLEALLLGVSFNLDHLEALPAARVAELFEQLRQHEELSEERLSDSLSKTARVQARVKAAKDVFSQS